MFLDQAVRQALNHVDLPDEARSPRDTARPRCFADDPSSPKTGRLGPRPANPLHATGPSQAR